MHAFSNRPPLIERCAVAFLLIGAGAFIAVYVVTAVVRLQYPFELEWMEGGSVAHVQRVLNGQTLYNKPSLDFTPFIYTPFYYYVSSLPALLWGNGFFPLRLTSFAASIASMVVIWLIVHRRAQSATAAFLAASLFAATFKLTGAWLDLARVDSLALFFTLAGAYLLDRSMRPVHVVAAGVLLFLAFFTKQSFLVVGAALTAAVFIASRGRERWLMPLSLVLLTAGSTFVLNAASNGWFGYYVFEVPSRHPIESAFLTAFWSRDLGSQLPIAIGFALWGLFSVGADANRHEVIKDSALFGGLILSSYLSRIHSGGFDNVLIPAVAGIAIFFGSGFAAARTAVGQRRWVGLMLAAAAAIQFLMLAYSPRYLVPTRAARLQGQQLLDRLGAIDGDIYIAEHPWYAVMAGKAAPAHPMALSDLMRAAGGEDIHEALAQEMRVAVEQEKYAAFVVDMDNFLLRPSSFELHYRLADAHLSGDDFVPTTGMHKAPRLLFIRRSPVH